MKLKMEPCGIPSLVGQPKTNETKTKSKFFSKAPFAGQEMDECIFKGFSPALLRQIGLILKLSKRLLSKCCIYLLLLQ